MNLKADISRQSEENKRMAPRLASLNIKLEMQRSGSGSGCAMQTLCENNVFFSGNNSRKTSRWTLSLARLQGKRELLHPSHPRRGAGTQVVWAADTAHLVPRLAPRCMIRIRQGSWDSGWVLWITLTSQLNRHCALLTSSLRSPCGMHLVFFVLVFVVYLLQFILWYTFIIIISYFYYVLWYATTYWSPTFDNELYWRLR